MIISGLIGSLILLTGDIISLIIGSIFFIFLNILDTTDGELARFKKNTSVKGDYLDRIGHYVTNSMFFLCTGLGLFIITDSVFILYISILLEISYTADELLRDLLITCKVESEGARKPSKKRTKIYNKFLENKFFHKIFFATSTNLAFFHIIFITSILDYFIFFNALTTYYYFIYFTLFTCLKLILRIRIIYIQYFKSIN
mgnify:CR=1 FL=1